MLPIAFAPCYAHALPEGHRFPMLKYELLPEQLLREGTATATDFFVAQPPSDEDILRVHDADYYQRLRLGQLTRQEERATGFPWSAALFEREITILGGTIEAARLALVHVEVHDEDFADGGHVGQQPGGGGSLVVEQAKPFAPRPKRVVRAPGNVECHAVHQGQARRLDGAAQDGNFALKQGRRPREARGPFLGPRELPQAQALVIAGIVHAQNVGGGRRLGREKISRRGRAFAQQLFGQQLVLEHGKAVAGGQRVGVAGREGNGKHEAATAERAAGFGQRRAAGGK